MIDNCTIYQGDHNDKESIAGDYIQSNYYTTRSKPPLAEDAVFVKPSRDILAVKKLDDVVFKLLFITIAVVTLLVETVVDAVLSSNSKKQEQLNIGYN